MNASGLIKKIEDAIAKHGDLPVGIREETADGYDLNDDICIMEFLDDDGKKLVIS